jgi:hypothetical protein
MLSRAYTFATQYLKFIILFLTSTHKLCWSTLVCSISCNSELTPNRMPLAGIQCHNNTLLPTISFNSLSKKSCLIVFCKVIISKSSYITWLVTNFLLWAVPTPLTFQKRIFMINC